MYRAGVERLGGDLARQARRLLVEGLTGEDLVAREAILAKARLMAAELSGPAPTPLESLLVDRIVCSWLAVADADYRVAWSQRADSKASMTQLDFQQRRQGRALSRLLASVRTLALVRRLALPLLVVPVPARQPPPPRPIEAKP